MKQTKNDPGKDDFFVDILVTCENKHRGEHIKRE